VPPDYEWPIVRSQCYTNKAERCVKLAHISVHGIHPSAERVRKCGVSCELGAMS
jgi:hypothetical protein